LGITVIKMQDERTKLKVVGDKDLASKIIRCSTLDHATGCWIWKLSKEQGYGRIQHKFKRQSAHAASYRCFIGILPDGLVADHLCKNTECVNPYHLEAMTNIENVMRGNSPAAINATKTHCPQGHKYDEKNTIWRTRRDGRAYRVCRLCSRQHAMNYYYRKRGM
jgi:hypothetical protein